MLQKEQLAVVSVRVNRKLGDVQKGRRTLGSYWFLGARNKHVYHEALRRL